MGGVGSGRPRGSGRATAEDHRSIDANQLNRHGCLSPGWIGGWEWKRDGERVAWISLAAEGDQDQGWLRLDYRVRAPGCDWEGVNQAVRIVRVPCRLGGSRPYFICPGMVGGIACRRRVLKLYGAGRHFLCRLCYRLAYASQSEDDLDRALRRANRIRVRLGGEPGTASLFPRKPRGMWSRTYDRLSAEALAAEELAEEAFTCRVLGKLAGRSLLS